MNLKQILKTTLKMSNWVVIYKSNNPNNANIVKSVLEDNEIDMHNDETEGFELADEKK